MKKAKKKKKTNLQISFHFIYSFLSKDCTPCNARLQYQLSACTTTTDRVCAPISACQPGFYETVAPTSTSNRACSACTRASSCIAGQQFLNSSCTANSNPYCSNCTTSCPRGYFLRGVCTQTVNPTCQVCSTCPNLQYITGVCSGTLDTACSNCTTSAECSAGHLLQGVCTGTTNFQCVAPNITTSSTSSE